MSAVRFGALTLRGLVRQHRNRFWATWAMALIETGLMALVPLFTAFAIDGLLADSLRELGELATLMALLIVVAVLRRLYDTRVYGTARVALGETQCAVSRHKSVSAINAQLAMGRELVDFLEHTLPEAMAAVVQFVVAFAILSTYSLNLAAACGLCLMAIAGVYTAFHGEFYRLNAALNRQVERQVGVLGRRRASAIRHHLLRLRHFEVRISDREAVLYGVVFLILMALMIFNLWHAATHLSVTVGLLFAIVSYSWECVDSALALPFTLQALSRLSEIQTRIDQRSADQNDRGQPRSRVEDETEASEEVE